MTLPASQQHLLDGIEGELRTTEPRLAGMFAVFTRLTRDEALPRAEQLEAKARRWRSRLSPRRSGAVASGRSRPRRLISGTRVLLLLIPLSLVGLVIAIVGTSTPNARAACWAQQARLSHTVHQKAQTCLAAVGQRGSEVWLGPRQVRSPAS